MHYLRTILWTLLLSFSICGLAINAFAQNDTPENVVKSLYQDFGWELTTNNRSKGSLIDQPESTLARYFTPKLAGLIARDRKYVKRTKELGHIDFAILCGSQDPDGIRNIRIVKKPGKDVVVTYDQSGEKDVMKIDYVTLKTKSGWRISNVHYKSRKSTAFPEEGIEMSLISVLDQPY